jgi:hypothetical protein
MYPVFPAVSGRSVLPAGHTKNHGFSIIYPPVFKKACSVYPKHCYFATEKSGHMRRLRMRVIKNMATNAPPAISTADVTGLFGSFSGGTGVLVAGWLVGAGTGFVLSSVGGNACVPAGSVGTETAG